MNFEKRGFMKLVLITLFLLTCVTSQAKVLETVYETFDGGLRIEGPFQMECNIQNKHYIIFVNFGEFRIKVLEEGEWVVPSLVRFSPDSLLVMFAEEHTKANGFGARPYGFVLGNIRFNYPRPIRGVYRDFVPGRTTGNPYVSIPEACNFINM